MSDTDSLRRLAIAGVILAIAVSVPANIAFFAAFGWNLEATIFGEPSAILGGGSDAAGFLRWGAIGDMFYSYLLLVPLALFLHGRLRPIRPWLADLGTLAGLAYIFVGAAGAAMLGIAGSSLVDAYSRANAADQAGIATSFGLVRDVVFFALWQMLDALTLGAWILSVGVLLMTERRLASRFLIVIGAATMAASAMTMTGVHSIVVLGLGLVVAFAVWVGWLMLDRMRGPSGAA